MKNALGNKQRCGAGFSMLCAFAVSLIFVELFVVLVVWDHEKDDVHTVGAAPLSQVIDTDWC